MGTARTVVSRMAAAAVSSRIRADPACCPSGFADTTYAWDTASGTLIVAGDPVMIPSPAFEGWDAARQRLKDEGFFDALPGF